MSLQRRCVRHKLEAFHGRRDPKARRGRLAVPRPRRPLHPLRRPRRPGAPGPEGVARAAPRPRRTRSAIAERPAGPGPRQRPRTRSTASRPIHRLTRRSGLACWNHSTRFDWDRLDEAQRLDLLRVYAVLFNRIGRPDGAERQRSSSRLRPALPGPGAGSSTPSCASCSSTWRLPDRRPEALKLHGRRADAGGADRVRQVAARVQGRLDAGTAEGVLHLVPQGGTYRAGPASPAS